MSKELVASMNQIILEWKTEFINQVQAKHPDNHLPADLATKSWSEVLKTTYPVIKPKKPCVWSLYTMYFLNMAFKLKGFNDYPNVEKFYRNVFGGTTVAAKQFTREGLFINPNTPKEKSFAILPAGTPYNYMMAMGIQRVVPYLNVYEIFTVSENKFAHQVDPLLFFDLLDTFVIKAVPELPKPMLEYAQKHNIKVR